MKPERILQLQLSQWLKAQYRDVWFNLDTSGDFKGKQAINQAKQNKKMRTGSKWPDMFIAEARGGYFGLYIELKVTTPFKKDGTIKASKDDHLKKQAEKLDGLNARGYMACFGIGLESSMATIKMYLSQPLTESK